MFPSIKKYIFFSLLLGLQCHCQNNSGPLVHTVLGKIQGYWKTSHEDRIFSAFEGIPYAKPPTGNRRFAVPEPPEPWNHLLNATFLTACPQTSLRKKNTLFGQENCLYINVYVPRKYPNPQEKLDVIIHVHGGAFMYGSGHYYARPELLMDKEIIFVTFNYRLNIFGFLSTEDDVVSGNNGPKDQVMALTWVQSNIVSFGGNPDSVTLTGLSAGGASVHLHYLSPMSRGLFHRGFSQSGVALNPWVIQEEPLLKAKILAASLDCPTESTFALVECLKQKPYLDILERVPLFFGYQIFPLAPFGPVVEKGKGAFLNKDPYHLLVQGKIQDVPWLVSATAHEGLIVTEFLEKDLKTVNEKWEDLTPIILDYNYTLPRFWWKSTANKVKDFYIGKNQKITEDNLLTWTKIFSDRYFLVGTEEAVRLHANATKSSVFYYHFSYPGDNSTTVGHGDDRKYFFGNYVPNSRPLTPNEFKMKNILLDMLVSFAKTGTPKIGQIQWEPAHYSKLKYLNISTFETERIEVESADELTPKDFWDSLGILENENLFSGETYYYFHQ